MNITGEQRIGCRLGKIKSEGCACGAARLSARDATRRRRRGSAARPPPALRLAELLDNCYTDEFNN